MDIYFLQQKGAFFNIVEVPKNVFYSMHSYLIDNNISFKYDSNVLNDNLDGSIDGQHSLTYECI